MRVAEAPKQPAATPERAVSVDARGWSYSTVHAGNLAAGQLLIQRACACGGTCPECRAEDERKRGLIQRAAAEPGSAGAGTLGSLLQRSQGRFLDPGVRAGFEPRLGGDLSAVRVHTDGPAAEAATGIGAHAFTAGQDIYFAAGRYQPHTVVGRRLIAHELTHTVQQRGRTSSLQGQFMVNPPDDVYEHEANRVAETVGRNPWPGPAPTPVASSPGPVAVQRQAVAVGAPPAATASHPVGSEPEEDAMNEAEVRASIAADDARDQRQAEPSTEGAPASGGEAEVPPGEEAEPVSGAGEEMPAAGATEEPEVVIPDSATGGGPAGADECLRLVPEELPEPAVPGGGGSEPSGGDEGFFSRLLSFVPRALMGPLGLFSAAAEWIWFRLPFSVRAGAINRAIDGAIATVTALPGRNIMGMMWGWVQAGLTAFLERIRRLEDREKVTIFERIGRILLGGDLRFLWGFVKGLLKGFFIDGLVGIVQMVLDTVCIVPRIIRFVESIVRFLTHLPEELESAWKSIRGFAEAVGRAIRGAFDELTSLLRSPSRITELLDRIYATGASLAQRAGEMIADTLINFFRQSAERLGEIAGRIVGQIIFEVVLAVVTAGGGAAATAAKALLRTALEMLGEIGRRMLQVIRFLVHVFEYVKNLVLRVKEYLTRLFRAVAETLYSVIEWIVNLFNRLLGRCRQGGSTHCRWPGRRRGRPRGATGCTGVFVRSLGGFGPHNRYCARVTHRTMDFWIRLGPVLRCAYDAKVGSEVIECKTGYGWLASPWAQQQHWYRWAWLAIEARRYRCLVTASRCGLIYKWYMQNRRAAEFLRSQWTYPPVEHRP